MRRHNVASTTGNNSRYNRSDFLDMGGPNDGDLGEEIEIIEIPDPVEFPEFVPDFAPATEPAERPEREPAHTPAR